MFRRIKRLQEKGTTQDVNEGKTEGRRLSAGDVLGLDAPAGTPNLRTAQTVSAEWLLQLLWMSIMWKDNHRGYHTFRQVRVSIKPQTPQCIYTMYIYTLCNTPYIHCSATTMYIGYTMYIQRKNVTQCIYTMYINMLHNVYWECTTMYIGTMLPDAHLQRI